MSNSPTNPSVPPDGAAYGALSSTPPERADNSSSLSMQPADGNQHIFYAGSDLDEMRIVSVDGRSQTTDGTSRVQHSTKTLGSGPESWGNSVLDPTSTKGQQGSQPSSPSSKASQQDSHSEDEEKNRLDLFLESLQTTPNPSDGSETSDIVPYGQTTRREQLMAARLDDIIEDLPPWNLPITGSDATQERLIQPYPYPTSVFLTDTGYSEADEVSRKLRSVANDSLPAQNTVALPPAGSSRPRVLVHGLLSKVGPEAGHSAALRSYRSLVEDPTEFAHHWEKCVVPYLVGNMRLFSKQSSSVNVVWNAGAERRDIIFMSGAALDLEARQAFQRMVLEALPSWFLQSTGFVFVQGKIAVCQSPGNNQDEDQDGPVNWSWHQTPVMGDSAGVGQEPGGTLGPLLQIDGQGYWMVNCHIGRKALQNILPGPREHREIVLYHPQCEDYRIFREAYQQELGPHPPPAHNLGHLVAWSGEPFATVRASRYPFRGTTHNVVTDWMLFKSKGLHKNKIRRTTRNNEDEDALSEEITSGRQVVPSRRIVTSGRTSGFTHGYICEVPAVVLPGIFNEVDLGDGKFLVKRGNSTMVPTREWCISMHPGDPEDMTPLQTHPAEYKDWVEAGSGVSGDSGSPVVDADDNVLYGQVWGRNQYDDCDMLECVDGVCTVKPTDEVPLLTYFTSYEDLCDDIQQRLGCHTRPELPNDESIRRAAQDRLAARREPMRSCSKAGPMGARRLPATLKKAFIAGMSVPNCLAKAGNPQVPVMV